MLDDCAQTSLPLSLRLCMDIVPCTNSIVVTNYIQCTPVGLEICGNFWVLLLALHLKIILLAKAHGKVARTTLHYLSNCPNSTTTLKFGANFFLQHYYYHDLMIQLMKVNAKSLKIFWNWVNKLQIFKVEVIETPTIDTRLFLTPKCPSSFLSF